MLISVPVTMFFMNVSNADCADLMSPLFRAVPTSFSRSLNEVLELLLVDEVELFELSRLLRSL